MIILYSVGAEPRGFPCLYHPQTPEVILPTLQRRYPGWEMLINGTAVSASEVPARSMSRVAAPPGGQHRDCHVNGQKPP